MAHSIRSIALLCSTLISCSAALASGSVIEEWRNKMAATAGHSSTPDRPARPAQPQLHDAAALLSLEDLSSTAEDIAASKSVRDARYPIAAAQYLGMAQVLGESSASQIYCVYSPTQRPVPVALLSPASGAENSPPAVPTATALAADAPRTWLAPARVSRASHSGWWTFAVHTNAKPGALRLYGFGTTPQAFDGGPGPVIALEPIEVRNFSRAMPPARPSGTDASTRHERTESPESTGSSPESAKVNTLALLPVRQTQALPAALGVAINFSGLAVYRAPSGQRVYSAVGFALQPAGFSSPAFLTVSDVQGPGLEFVSAPLWVTATDDNSKLTPKQLSKLQGLQLETAAIGFGTAALFDMQSVEAAQVAGGALSQISQVSQVATAQPVGELHQ